MTVPPIKRAAERLATAAAEDIPCPPVRDLIGDADLAAAYAVQEIGTMAALQRGARLVGRKIGLTSPAVQKQLGVDQPDFGMLFADMEVPLGGEVPSGAVLQPKCEAEIAFVLERDLNLEQPTIADVLRAVAFALPAIEIVGSRIAAWDIRIADTIADNASSGLYVLGHSPKQIGQIDLTGCGMTLHRNGALEVTGSGGACMGSPLNALLWLARTMVRSGRPLGAGDVVLSGALGPMIAARPGDALEAHIQGIGRVSVSFAGEGLA